MGCKVMFHCRGGRGGGVGWYSRFRVTGMIKGYGLLSKDFLGFEIFDFGVACLKSRFFFIVKTYVSVFRVISFNAF